MVSIQVSSMQRKLVAAAVLGGLVMAGCSRPAPSSSSVANVGPAHLHRAMQSLTDVIVYDIFSPPQAARAYAYASVAAYEVVRQGDTATRSFAGQLRDLTPLPPAPRGVSLPVAGIHAFMTVGKALTFSQARMDSLRQAMDEEMRGAGLDAEAFKASIAYGDTAAAFILAWAGKDHYRESRGLPKYTVTKEPGRWIPTPPAYMDAVEPNWGTIRPFVLDSASQFRAPAPHPYSLAKGSPFMRAVTEVYTTGKGLTEEQRAIAGFWDCNPYTMHVQGHTMFATKKVSPGGHWMGIAGQVSRQKQADLVGTAEAYARTAVALADGFLSVWETKYATNYIRPETVINQSVDPAWQPLLQTPPFPEYTSGHSVISTAASEVLSALYGDSLAFGDSVEVAYGLPVRSFPSFRAAAAEAAISRLYGGIHYRQAIEEGQAQGKKVGQLFVARVHTRGGAQVASAAPAPVAR